MLSHLLDIECLCSIILISTLSMSIHSSSCREADGTPIQNRPALVERTPSLNDEVREKLRERIRMMEDSEPEDDVNWRESDIF